MNRITALLIAAIALATGAYLWWESGRGLAVEEAADAVGEAAGGALDGTTEALTDAPAEAADGPTGPDVETGVATGMEETLQGAAEGALPQTAPGAEAAVDALDAPVADAAGGALPEGFAPELLTAEGFDAERVRALIAASGLGDLQKSTLTAALDAAVRGDATLAEVLDEIRAAFGL
jgi:SWI/SNF-related matrix-associated actin-dependent regulator 1 of chromatin subfamily A